MKLISVTVRNYRIHKEVTIPFDHGLTVIAGPNESGKSTLVEAIHHALFLRSKVSGEIAQSLRSQLHAGHPTVILEFEADSKRWTIEKTFTGTASGSTTLKEQGGRTRHNQEAEEEIHRLLQEEDAGGGKGIAERIRNCWAYLWVWQGTAGADPGEKGSGDRSIKKLRQRLGQLGGGSVLESTVDSAVSRSLLELLAESYTDKGKLKTGSELARAADELSAAEAARVAAEGALGALDKAVCDVDAAERALADGTRSVAKIRGELEAVQKRREELTRIDAALAEGRMASAAAGRAHDELQSADTEIRSLDGRIRASEVAMQPAHDDLRCVKAAEVAHRARFDAALAGVRECTGKHRDAAALAERQALVEQVERQRVERRGLASRCDLILTHRKQADLIRTQLRGLPRVKPADVETLVTLQRAADAADAELRAIATRVELIAADAPVRLGAAEFKAGDAETITSATDILIGGSTRLRVVPGGGRSLAECTRKSDAAAAAVEARLATLGVATTEAARGAAATLTRLTSELRVEENSAQGLGDEKALSDLAALDEAIAELDLQIARLASEGFSPATSFEAALAARRAAHDEVSRLALGLAAANTECEVAQKLSDGALAEHTRIAESIRSEQDTLADLRSRRQALVEKVGEERAVELATRHAARREAEDRLAVTESRRADFEPATVERDQKRVQSSLEQRQEEMRAAETRRQLALATFHAAGTSDPADDRARAVAREAAAAAMHRRLEHDAQAAKLLADLFRETKQAVEDRFSEPLKARVGDYLQRLFGPGAEVSIDLVGDAIGALSLVRPAGGAVPFEFGSLSGGTREQVGAALRLALAEILAEDHDGCLPVVFDDAFVNADPERLLGLERMLDLAAERGLQVVVLTCDPTAYDTLGVGITHIQRPGGIP